jgi:uncharacterized membrane protein
MVKVRPISSNELWMAEAALFVAIALQVAVWGIGESLTFGPQYPIILTEVLLAVIIRFSAQRRQLGSGVAHRPITVLLLALISLGNIGSFILVAQRLIMGESALSGRQLLVSAIAIFLTNIIVFALWYWEIDSPGLTGKKWSKHDKDFQFTQQDLAEDFKNWQPSFIDYLYLSMTNAVNFAPADVRPLTAQAKVLMGTQSLVSVFTLALVVARSVSILG